MFHAAAEPLNTCDPTSGQDQRVNMTLSRSVSCKTLERQRRGQRETRRKGKMTGFSKNGKERQVGGTPPEFTLP